MTSIPLALTSFSITKKCGRGGAALARRAARRRPPAHGGKADEAEPPPRLGLVVEMELERLTSFHPHRMK
jgi:hypothetical protein